MWSEKLLKNGIRTHRVLGLALLEEIIDEEGRRITIQEAKERGMMPPDMQPVAEVRAFGTRERVLTLEGATDARREAMLEDARAIVAQEIGVPFESFSNEQYVAWFASELGRQIAKLRKLRLYHRYIELGHNVTLDCRIVDLDSLDDVNTGDPGLHHTAEGRFSHDYKGGETVLENLINFIETTRSYKSYKKLCVRSEKMSQLYREAYNTELQKSAESRKPKKQAGASAAAA